MIHQLKLKSKYFEKVISGEKTFEIRVDDRHYQQGDYLALNEIDNNGIYTGRSCAVCVDYVLRKAEGLLPEGVVCMAIKPCRILKMQEVYNQNYAIPPEWNKVPILTNKLLKDPKKIVDFENAKEEK